MIKSIVADYDPRKLELFNGYITPRRRICVVVFSENIPGYGTHLWMSHN